MKSWYAICGLTLTLFCLNVQAAPVHETARLTQDFVNGGWVDELYEGPGDFSVAPLAREEFRTIPQAQTISLHFGDPNRDLFAELITKREAAPIQFFYDWVGYLFGLRTWGHWRRSELICALGSRTAVYPGTPRATHVLYPARPRLHGAHPVQMAQTPLAFRQVFDKELRVKPHLEPVEPPVEMRTG